MERLKKKEKLTVRNSSLTSEVLLMKAFKMRALSPIWEGLKGIFPECQGPTWDNMITGLL